MDPILVMSEVVSSWGRIFLRALRLASCAPRMTARAGQLPQQVCQIRAWASCGDWDESLRVFLHRRPFLLHELRLELERGRYGLDEPVCQRPCNLRPKSLCGDGYWRCFSFYRYRRELDCRQFRSSRERDNDSRSRRDESLCSSL